MKDVNAVKKALKASPTWCAYWEGLDQEAREGVNAFSETSDAYRCWLCQPAEVSNVRRALDTAYDHVEPIVAWNTVMFIAGYATSLPLSKEEAVAAQARMISQSRRKAAGDIVGLVGVVAGVLAVVDGGLTANAVLQGGIMAAGGLGARWVVQNPQQAREKASQLYGRIKAELKQMGIPSLPGELQPLS